MKESKFIEYKEKLTRTYLKTVSAFSNYGAGKIFFGIDDQGESVGISDPDKACLNIENQINDSIKPKPEYSLSINRRTNVVTLVVEEGVYKPYQYNGRAYKRHDTATVEVDQIELKRLVLEGSNQYYEQLPYSPDEMLTFDTLREKLTSALGLKEINGDIFRTLNLYSSDGVYNNAAGLLADDNFFSGMDITRYGANINEILNRYTIVGKSVLTQYDSAVEIFEQFYEYEVIDGITRTSKESVPKEAFREAVANAIVHRTWDIKSNIRISMYQDKIEIISPGGLPTGLTEDEYLRGSVSNLRNPILGNLFFRLHLIEMFGTGIKRIMYSYTGYDVKPGFEIYANSIIVTLPSITYKLSLSSDERSVYGLFASEREWTSSEIAEKLSYRKSKTVRILNALIDKRYIKVLGRGRGTRYTK